MSIGVAFLSTWADLSTWAEREVRDSVEAGGTMLQEAVTKALIAARALPDSEQGRAIAEQLRLAAMNEFALDAYASGFRVLALLVGTLAVLLALTFIVTGSGHPASVKD